MRSDNVGKGIFGWLSSGRGPVSALRMAPMIDMTFLLLIFFLVAAKWRPKEDFLPFQLSTAGAQEQRVGRPEPLIIYISPAQTGCQVQIGQFGTVQIESDSAEADMVVLMEEIKNCLVAQKRYASDPVEIICGPDVKWNHLAKIYNVFFGAGLTDITFQMTEQPKRISNVE